MQIITLDFETFYDEEYTLSKMTTEAYVRDKRFEAHGASIRWPQGNTIWYDDTKPTLRDTLNNIDWANTGVVAHHAQFDGLILSHHFNIKPAQWFCTYSMARLVVGNHISVGLGSLAGHFGLGAKTIDYNAFRGRRWSQMTSDVKQMLADGCNHDVELTWLLFQKLLGGEVR